MILWFSKMLLPLVISYVIAFGLISRRPIFDDFLDGAKSGMKTVADILPTLIGLITAVGVVRASGLLDAITDICAGAAGLFHIPQELVPITLVRLVSNSAATGLLLDMFRQYGPDSRIGMAASVIMSSTETVFYCLSIYFGSVKCAGPAMHVPGALIATAAGLRHASGLRESKTLPRTHFFHNVVRKTRLSKDSKSCIIKSGATGFACSEGEKWILTRH